MKGLDSTAKALDRHVGSRLRARREMLNLSAAAFGLKVDTPASEIERYETGAEEVQPIKLWAMSRALKVSLGYFFQ